ncbi:MAG: SDR family NAD(P)-dependent oxidoreductase [Planctomycetota bacterium]|jgi:3-oxoacyl-[acyl-carrier protein] reductase|nr:SDR family NAD(P)-dependent oxidoreductase [Planctomycetota bacterium]
MDFALKDKTVLVTGASGGIGRALAESFLEEGARVALQGHTQFDAMQHWLAKKSADQRDRSLCLRGDLSNSDDCDQIVATISETWGRLDVCIANAGHWPPDDIPLHAMDPQRMRRTLEVNLLGSAWTARAFLKLLASTGPRDDGHGASLIFVGSTAGRYGERHHADYATAKAGLTGLMATLKHEIVDIDPFGRVNCIEPGWTVTHKARPDLLEAESLQRVLATMPLRQLGRATDIARTALYLASPTLARHVTGQTLVVAGGMEGRMRWQPGQVDENAVKQRLAQDEAPGLSRPP